MSKRDIYQEITKERRYQEERWGKEFDDRNTMNDWGTYIVNYLSDGCRSDVSAIQRKSLIKVAALAVAALEALDRNEAFPKRHYD